MLEFRVDEKLLYVQSLDFLVRFLEYLSNREGRPEDALQMHIRCLVNALHETLGTQVLVLFWDHQGDGQVAALEASNDVDLGPSIEWSPDYRFPMDGKPIVLRFLEKRDLLIVGHALKDEVGLEGELWILVAEPRKEDSDFLRHRQSWEAIKKILRLAVEESLAQRFLSIIPGLFDDRAQGFLSLERLEKLEKLSLEKRSRLPGPVIHDLMTIFMQAGLLIDVEAPWLGFRGNTRPLTQLKPSKILGEELANSLRESPSHKPLVEILDALQGELVVDSNSAPALQQPYNLKQDAQTWLAHWTAMLGSLNGETSSALQRKGPLGDGSWASGLEAMVAACGRFLTGWAQPNIEREALRIFGGDVAESKPKVLDSTFTTPWVRLWFCYELLRLEWTDEGFRQLKQSQTRRLRYRRSLIYVLRENVRFFLFGRRADYRFRPRLLGHELRRLVVHHAERALGIDASLDLGELLHRIERSGDAGARELASGHLQHVFEVYIAGQFIGGLGMGASSNAPDLWSHWARKSHKPFNLERLALRRSFAIAALLHDFGSLLFPSWSREIIGGQSPMPTMAEDLNRLASDLQASGQRLGNTAMADLRQHDGLFSESEWQAIEDWHGERLSRLGEPEPAVIGAWYVRGLMQQAGLGADLQQHVVRAMVLDRVVTLPIDLDSDPVAALLVVCDSLFAWEPSPPRRDELVIGRAFSSLQASGRSVAARYDSMHIPNLRLGLKEVENLAGEKVEVFGGWITAIPWGFPAFHLQSGESERNDPEACLDLWLDLSTSLGRIGSSLGEPDQVPLRHGTPWIRVTTKRPSDLKNAGLDIENLVGEVAQLSTAPLRRALERWLARKEEECELIGAPVPSATEGASKTKIIFELGPRGKSFADQDPQPWFDEFRQHCERVILQRLASRQGASEPSDSD